MVVLIGMYLETGIAPGLSFKSEGLQARAASEQ